MNYHQMVMELGVGSSLTTPSLIEHKFMFQTLCLIRRRLIEVM